MVGISTDQFLYYLHVAKSSASYKAERSNINPYIIIFITFYYLWSYPYISYKLQ